MNEMKTRLTTNSFDFKHLSRLKLLARLASTLTLVATSSITTPAAVIAHWKFDESSGPTAHDSAGPFDGALSPTGAAFATGGVIGNALSLSRVDNGFVNMGNVLGLTSGDFSIVVWLKMNAGDTSAETVVLSKHERSYHNGYLIGINSIGGGGQLDKAMFYEGSVVNAPISTTTVNDGSWHQVVAVFRGGGNKSIYVDGSPAESIQASECFGGNSGPFLIGGTGSEPAGNYSGLIDEVQIYDHAISDADVDYLFQHPSQTVLDSAQQLAVVQAQLGLPMPQSPPCKRNWERRIKILRICKMKFWPSQCRCKR